MKLRSSNISDLPITDLSHVLKEINWLRRYKETNRLEQQRRADYMKKYKERNNGL